MQLAGAVLGQNLGHRLVDGPLHEHDRAIEVVTVARHGC
jgi:hypothetical protein